MLEIRHVSVEFRGAAVKAVDDMSLVCEDGSRTAIIGETGSGKSVLLVALIRLLPANAAISGQVLLDGVDLLQADKRTMNRLRGNAIAYVPQGGGAGMNPLMRVGEQVGEPLVIHRGYTRKRAFGAAEALLERFNLTPGSRLARDYPHMFSGGMRQRAMVAMGVAAGAGLLLADEPTKGLDNRRVETVIDAFNRLKDETLLCVTHDIVFARAISRKVSVMYAAQQLEYGDTREVLDHPLHPYTRDLVNAMPENGMRYDDHGFAPPHSSYLDAYAGCRYRDRCREAGARCAQVPPMARLGERTVRCWKYASED